MDKLRKIIKETVSKIFESEEEKYFNGMLIVIDILKGDKPKWEPLYNFLKQIFQDKYLEAANGFMFYGAYRIEGLVKLDVFQYRHGITRKYFYLNENGQPLKLLYTKNSKGENVVESVKEISYEDQFKEIYSSLILSIKKACDENNCEIPEDSYLMSYNDYKVLRDKMLEKHGYQVASIKSQEDIEKFGDNLEEKWSTKYKKSIDCSNPKGFSQKAHCAARKKRQSGEKTKSKSLSK